MSNISRGFAVTAAAAVCIAASMVHDDDLEFCEDEGIILWNMLFHHDC